MTTITTVLYNRTQYVAKANKTASGAYQLELTQHESKANDFGSVIAAAEVVKMAVNPYNRKFKIIQNGKEKDVPTGVFVNDKDILK